MQTVLDLEEIGYTFSIEGDRLRYRRVASSPRPEAVALLTAREGHIKPGGVVGGEGPLAAR